VTVREIIFKAAVFIWFVSALGLFFRSRLAWFGCLLGIGLATYISACFLIDSVRDSFFPAAADAQHMAGGFVVAHILAIAAVLALATACFTLSVGLFIGLMKSRKELK